MTDKYGKIAKIFKALSDPKRVQILDLLSKGEVCACTLLEHFHISQPTLSHDMRLLIDVEVVKSRRDGQRMLYSLDMETLREMQRQLLKIIEDNSGPSQEESAPEQQSGGAAG